MTHNDKEGACAQHTTDLIDEVSLISRAFDGVGDLLNPDSDLGFHQRDNVACLMMVLQKCMDQALDNLRNTTPTPQL